MPGRLAADFGTSNTVLAVWQPAAQAAEALHVADYGRLLQQGDGTISVVPSLIHYAEDGARWIGNQVLERNLYRSRRTFRWMKRYINNRSPVKVNLDGRQVSHFDAGQDFLSAVLLFAAGEMEGGQDEIALTVPVEAFEHYEDWLAGVAEAAGLPRFRLIDEPSAAALGYGAHIQPGDVYLIFDFGGGTLHAAVVLVEASDAPTSGRRCRVLGKAGLDVGGTAIDGWLFQEVLRLNRLSDVDDEVRQVGQGLLVACEAAKERLSFFDRADISLLSPHGRLLTAEISRGRFEELLDEHEAFNGIDRTIRRALGEARERGFDEEDIKAVLLVGGSSQIPAVQATLRRIFGRERVMLDRPLDAVARGAAAFVAGVDFYDHIQHDYAIRWTNPRTGKHEFRILVKRGTPYPTSEPVAELTIKATYEGQTQLGIAIFEMGDTRAPGGSQPMELVFDPSGGVRVVPLAAADLERRGRFWMNEHHPTFLSLNEPADCGQRCFDVSFSVDGNKRLLITARDLAGGRLTHRDYPVVKLT